MMRSAVSPEVSVIICCYSMERLADVKTAVDSVIVQSLSAHEIVVSVDHARDVYERLKGELPASVRIVINEGAKGLSETRNTGIRASSGSIMAFIDDDAFAEPSWLEKLVALYHDPNVIAVGGKAVPLWETARPGWFAEELDWIVGCTHKGPSESTREVRNMIGCNMSYRREAFKAAGFFNPKVGRVGKLKGVGEEADVCLRIKHAMPEKRLMYVPEAIVYHRVPDWRATWKYMISRAFDEGFYKVVVKRLASGGRALSSEGSYLGFILGHAIPSRLRRFYSLKCAAQNLAMLICVGAVAMGYVGGSLRTR